MTTVQRKRTVLLRQHQAMDRAAFSHHWLTVHAALATRLPGLVRYVQNHVIRDVFCLTGRWCRHAGIAEITYANDTALALAQSSHLGAVLLPADEQRFLSEWTGAITTPSAALDSAMPDKTVLLLSAGNDRLIDSSGVRSLRRFLPSGARIEIEPVEAHLTRMTLPADPIRPRMIVYFQGLDPDIWRDGSDLSAAVAHLVGPQGDAVAYLVDERVLLGG
ncbi:EthD domain-containing protein [Actibacterium sp. EMB200-NS6]|uniref:EthD domain-containing protein n=1 Tax=Actibacterium sp. EMB200-NS6 TaxID=1609966 RepID=UPI0012FAF842|nr:EthD domain-containing protein [Actibacterium sp. EMB200-NS6]